MNFLFFLVLASIASPLPTNFETKNLLTSEKLNLGTRFTDKKAMVVVFMSSVCPCSNSHVEEVKSLASTFKDFKFVVVHSNANETLEGAKSYFEKLGFPFQVVRDEDSLIADSLKAYKTPHSFIISQNGEILYQGGITDSSKAANAKKHYLNEALSALASGQKIKESETRTLGCVIERKGDKNVW